MKTESQDTEGYARGDKHFYFIIHNIISMFLFFGLTNLFRIYPEFSLFNIVGAQFLQKLGLVFVISLFAAVSGRVLAFLFLKLIFFKYVIKGSKVRRWESLNQGLSRLDGAWVIAMLLSSITFMIGATILLQLLLFPSSENNLLSLMITYLIVKIIILFISRKKT
ncbi:MAG: hypothetical protein KJI71_01675 [Patescibacteria group bacterium]|nr:hypothetical protein [Patescibacteria group bacterium]